MAQHARAGRNAVPPGNATKGPAKTKSGPSKPARGRTALIYVDEDGGTQRTSFDEMRELSCRFANVLQTDGLTHGDRVAVFLSQSLALPPSRPSRCISSRAVGRSPSLFRRRVSFLNEQFTREPGRSR